MVYIHNENINMDCNSFHVINEISNNCHMHVDSESASYFVTIGQLVLIKSIWHIKFLN